MKISQWVTTNSFVGKQRINSLLPDIKIKTKIMKTKTLQILTILAIGFFIMPKIAWADTQNIMVTEIAAYESSGYEWIEIYNPTDTPIDLTGWTFYENETNHKLNEFQDDLIIDPQEYAIIADDGDKFLEHNPDFTGTIIDSSWTSLKESGEEIALVDNEKNIIEQFTYLPCPDTSLQKIDLTSDDYTENNWQEHPNSHTAGQENFFEEKNNDQVEVKTEDKKNDTTNIIITEDMIAKPDYKKQLLITELMPNPVGSDTHYEFIELKSITDQQISLTDWKIQDADKNTYKIPFVLLEPGEYFVIERKKSGIALNNDKDTLKLISPDNKTIQTITYQEDPEIDANASYALNSKNEWEWTDTITKGSYNIITPMNHPPIIDIYCPKQANINQSIICDASDSYDTENNDLTFKWEIENKIYPNPIAEFSFSQGGEYNIQLTIKDQEFTVTKTHKIKIISNEGELTNEANTNEASVSSQDDGNITVVTLEDVRKLEIGSKVITRGIVSALPNIFGKTIMYITGPGIQLYMYKSDWPDLDMGDLIEINGELSESKGETRIKLSTKEDIKIIAKEEEPLPYPINNNDVNENYEGSLVKIKGTLIQKTGSTFFIKDDIGEVQVYIKTNTKIDKKKYAEGDELLITGIVSQNNDVYQILPRGEQDIEKIQKIQTEKTPIEVSNNQKSQPILKYLIATSVFLLLGLSATFYKSRKNKNPRM